jgi:D-alanyl-lipoteichoic acid acyltransferase DltB (MBOAT superfamily)
MTFVRRIWHGGRIAFLALAGWLAVYGVALAQAQQPKKDEPQLNSSTYVMAYILVLFGVALGLLLVCRSSNRRERAKPEQFGEAKAGQKEDE